MIAFRWLTGLVIVASEIEPFDDTVNDRSCDYMRITLVLHVIGTLL